MLMPLTANCCIMLGTSPSKSPDVVDMTGDESVVKLSSNDSDVDIMGRDSDDDVIDLDKICHACEALCHPDAPHLSSLVQCAVNST